MTNPPLSRYRLRKKYPFPATVWNGERKLYTYKESARNLLEDFYTSNKYPTPDQVGLLNIPVLLLIQNIK